MIRLMLLACLLASPCLAQQTLTPANLELVGGFRLPSFYPDINPTAAFATGNFALDTDGDTTRVWYAATQTSGSSVLLEASTDTPMGDAETAKTSWPLLDEVSVTYKSTIFGDRGGEANDYISGLVWDSENSRLWMTLVSGYWQDSDPEQWIAYIDYPGAVVGALHPDLSGKLKQQHCGGLAIIPQAFADAHFGGKRLGLLAGGYKSGQSASLGPTLSVMDLAPSADPAAERIMYWAETNEVGGDQAGTKDKVARIFPTYTVAPSGIEWQHPVEGDVGYWGTSNTRNGAWVKVPGFEGAIWFGRQPAGAMLYSYQSECFTNPAAQDNSSNLYVVTADQIAALTEEGADPWDEQPAFYPWNESNNGGFIYGQIPRGVVFDPDTNLIWVSYRYVWPSGFGIAAYRVVGLGGPQRVTVNGSLTLEVAE